MNEDGAQYLPAEILTIILEELEFHDLIVNARAVNKYWKEVIDETPNILRKCWRWKSESGAIIPAKEHHEAMIAASKTQNQVAENPIFSNDQRLPDKCEYNTGCSRFTKVPINIFSKTSYFYQTFKDHITVNGTRQSSLASSANSLLDIERLRSVLFSQPPVPKVNIVMVCSARNKTNPGQDDSAFSKLKLVGQNIVLTGVYRETGVTVGQILEKVNEDTWKGAYGPMRIRWSLSSTDFDECPRCSAVIVLDGKIED